MIKNYDKVRIFSLLKYPDSYLPVSLTAFKSCSKICLALFVFTISDCPGPSPGISYPPSPLLFSIAVTSVCFGLSSLEYNLHEGRDLCLLFTVVSTVLIKVSGTCCCPINIFEGMNEHTKYNCIVCKTSYFSM